MMKKIGRTVRRRIVAVGAAAVLVAAPGAADASIALGEVVSDDPANFTPHVSSGAVHKVLQVGNTIYAGGQFGEVSTAAGVSPGGTFARSNVFAFGASTGVVTSFAPSVNGQVWAMATDGSSLWLGGYFTAVNGVSRRGIVKLNPSTGVVDTAFNAGLGSGRVTELALVDGRLIAGGTFPGGIRAVNPATGANTGYMNGLELTGRVADNSGPTGVYRFAVNPAGTLLVAVGNFTAVGGVSRVRGFMLTLGSTSASLNPWYYTPLANSCRSTTTPQYMRDVDFSPDGSYFVFASTGFIPRSGGIGRDLCDAAARFETNVANPFRPTWINYTGGDTLHSVAVTDAAVYVQGHQRWLNNPYGSDNPGPGAVDRPGIGAIDPASGLANSWNPTKERGVGGKDLFVNTQGLWVGSDTSRIGGETHRRIALMPVG